MDHVNFTNTTTSWNIINLHNIPMTHHQDQDHHPLHCIPIWPLAFPLHMTQDQDQDQELAPAKIKNHDCDQDVDGGDDNIDRDQHQSDCIPMWPLASPLHIQEQDQDQELIKNNDQEMGGGDEEEELGAVKEMMYKMAAMRPVDVGPAAVRRPRRRNVRISDDPQSVAARRRRERISERMRVLQRLVPGGAKMDTAAMLDEAARYVRFLKRQIRRLQPSDDHHRPLPLPPPAPASIRVPSWPQYI